jgi:hypothetical protein
LPFGPLGGEQQRQQQQQQQHEINLTMMRTTPTTPGLSASSAPQASHRSNEVDIATTALLEMASYKHFKAQSVSKETLCMTPLSKMHSESQTQDLPDSEEMLLIICLYGPETVPNDLDFRHLAPHPCYTEHIFRAWNPTFHKRFYQTSNGKWLPRLGVSRERKCRRIKNKLSVMKLKKPINVLLPNREKLQLWARDR